MGKDKLILEKMQRFLHLEFDFARRYVTMVIEYVCPQVT